MNTVTLIDGSEVPSDSPLWAAECLTRHNHILTLRRLDTIRRRQYLDGVARKEGSEAARRLMDAYRADWEERKAAAQAANPAQETKTEGGCTQGTETHDERASEAV